MRIHHFLVLAATLAAPGVLAQDARELHASGLARFDEGDYPGAIGFFSRAVAVDPTLAVAWKDRGRTRYFLEDVDGAIADYDRALALDPSYKMAYNNRAAARRSRGDYQGAIADCDRAIEIDPRFDYAFIQRAATRFLLGDRPGGEADLARSRALGTGYVDYPQFWLWLEQARAGEREAADERLAAHVAERGEALTGPAARIAAFLLGKATEEELLEEIDEVPLPDQAAMRCEYRFYAGMRRLLDGDPEAARIHFRASIATGRWTYLEYHFANRELEAPR